MTATLKDDAKALKAAMVAECQLVGIPRYLSKLAFYVIEDGPDKLRVDYSAAAIDASGVLALINRAKSPDFKRSVRVGVGIH